MAEMRDVAVLGRDHPKVDALDKALGRAKFAADYYMPNMLYGGVFRSTVPHAIIKKLNMDKARALPGVACVLDYTAIPGKNRFGIIVKDEPCLVDDKVRRYGDAICVIAAETPEIVEEAKQLIEGVEYENDPIRLLGLSVSNEAAEEVSQRWRQLYFDFYTDYYSEESE